MSIAGKRYGRLIVQDRVAGVADNWRCICDCGKQRIARKVVLARGEVKSCGCLREIVQLFSGRKNRTHGLKKSREYAIWNQMLQRCGNSKNAAYHRYGGRGIRVCDEWTSFERFYAAVGQRLSPKHSIDRFPDADGNYEPGNVRWATAKEQKSTLGRYWSKRVLEP